jgi:hypothetical protein
MPAATPKTASLAWEKIVDDWGPDPNYMYQGTNPRMIVVADKPDIVAIENNLIPSHLRLVTDTDLTTFLVVVIYQGRKGSVRYSVEVTGIQQEGKAIRLYALFHEPKPGTPVGMVVTSPYYILKVKKNETMKGDMEFILIANGKEEDRQTHKIP